MLDSSLGLVVLSSIIALIDMVCSCSMILFSDLLRLNGVTSLYVKFRLRLI